MQVPNWIQPADPAQRYATGMALGQRQAEMEMGFSEAQMRMQMEQQRIDAARINAERDYQMQKQQMEITKAYHDQSMALQKQEIMETQARIRQAADIAQRRWEIQKQHDLMLEQLRQGTQQPKWVPPDPSSGFPGGWMDAHGKVAFPHATSTALTPEQKEADAAIKVSEGRITQAQKILGQPGLPDSVMEYWEKLQKNEMQNINERLLETKRGARYPEVDLAAQESKLALKPSSTNNIIKVTRDPKTGDLIVPGINRTVDDTEDESEEENPKSVFWKNPSD